MSGERLTRLYYNLVRPQSEEETAALMGQFRDMVIELFYGPDGADWDRGGLLAMVMQTRDIAGGKGEWGLFYLLMGELYLCSLNGEESTSDKLQETMVKMMESLVHSPLLSAANPRPYGSWKDFRACLTHLKELSGEDTLVRSKFFEGCIQAMVVQLQLDLSAPVSEKSLLAKWAPREKNKHHGWLARHLARSLADNNDEELVGSQLLARYRTQISGLNRELKTAEALQAQGAWDDIDFDRVPGRAMLKHARSFLYPYWDKDPLGEEASPCLARLACRKNYLGYLKDCAQGIRQAKTECLSPRTLVKEAISVTESPDLPDKETELVESAINLQWWREDAGEPEKKGPVIPIIDTSSQVSMESDDPLCAAIGLGLRLAETSSFGRRLVTYADTPVWVNLDEAETLTQAVRKVRSPSAVGSTADLLGAMDLIANACVEASLGAVEVAGITVVILSDSHSGAKPEAQVHSRIERIFHEAGKRSIHGAPYAPPHIVYWALRTRQPLPCAVTKKGVTLLSGYHVPTVRALCSNPCPGGEGWPPTPERTVAGLLAGGDRYTWLWGEAQSIPRPDSSAGWLW